MTERRARTQPGRARADNRRMPIDAVRLTPAGAAVTAPSHARSAAAAPAASFDVLVREQRRPPPPGAPPAGGPLGAAPAPPQPPGPAERAATRLITGERAMERAIAAATRGAQLTPARLLALQVQAQRYAIEVETVSRVVDRAASAVRQAMSTQV
jgi:hypothetical protein